MCQVEGIIPSSALASHSVEELTWHQFRDITSSDTLYPAPHHHKTHSVVLTYDEFSSNVPADFLLDAYLDGVSSDWMGAGLCMDDGPRKHSLRLFDDFRFPFTDHNEEDSLNFREECSCCERGNLCDGIVCTYQAPPPVSFNTIRSKDGSKSWRFRVYNSQGPIEVYSEEVHLWRRHRNRCMGLQGLL
ncbi:hypothetical protein GUITHDRAFT_146516 [Guillardia theta CCMP2712]|uniref:Uncharacterized protein n=1 Tax=Guillardia theta (strain CCMP2712) TaxID=905079 RepID=L1IH57_GUITC|nr:hypothetical protein GUITHDRAFT_146516 [Guillardia theta CCMP2712]EKX35412.1 hypothetical protein GUITHDRAFT_146516 [Guillardia theta CCMP2712]|eukprot:XP_005822392.1 hypothetical protein GUITHDRAFT_146516 [Guillardia theta CCMP2712]